jgi:hypothetical protein
MEVGRMNKSLTELQNFKKRNELRKIEIQKEIACLRREHETLDSVIGNLEDIYCILETEMEELEIAENGN